MHGAVFCVLRRALARCGFAVRTFSFPSVRRGLAKNTAALAAAIDGLDGQRVHLVGHSLGGLLVLNLLSRQADARLGRVVLMGSPCAGSHCATVLAGIPGGSAILGRSVADWNIMPPPRAPAGVDIGVISGDRSFGLGRLLPGLPKPNDGIVAVAETRLAQATDSITLHIGHSEMLWSRACARQIAAFLATGGFAHGNDSATRVDERTTQPRTCR